MKFKYSSIKRFDWICGFLVCATSFGMGATPSDFFALTGILSFILLSIRFIASIPISFDPKTNFTPPLFFILAFLISFYIPRFGFLVRDEIFKYNLQSYTLAVVSIEKSIQSGEAVPGRLALPAQFKWLARAVMVERSEDGVFTVEFLTCLGFPAKHAGYLYQSNGCEEKRLKKRWPALKRINDRWFYFNDF